jgi:hypothetical protein
MSGVVVPRTQSATPYRSGLRPGSDGFAALIRSEWTKFRSVRVWVLSIVTATAASVGFSAFLSSNGQSCPGNCTGQAPPTGPNGEPVTDSY